jgi:hypothetical protein
MSQTTFKNHGRRLCFLTLMMLFVWSPPSVAQTKTKGGAHASLSGKSTVPSPASVSHRVASANYKRSWGCDPFSRGGK